MSQEVLTLRTAARALNLDRSTIGRLSRLLADAPRAGCTTEGWLYYLPDVAKALVLDTIAREEARRPPRCRVCGADMRLAWLVKCCTICGHP